MRFPGVIPTKLNLLQPRFYPVLEIFCELRACRGTSSIELGLIGGSKLLRKHASSGT